MKKLICILISMFILTSCNADARSEVEEVISKYTNEEITIINESTTDNITEYTIQIPERKNIEVNVAQELDTGKISTDYIEKIVESNFDKIQNMAEKCKCQVEYDNGPIFYANNINDLEELSILFTNLDEIIGLKITKLNNITDNLNVKWPIQINNKTIYFPSLSTSENNRANVTDTFDYLKSQYEELFTKHK